MKPKGRFAALVADGLQEEYFLPKVALRRAEFDVEVLSTGCEPVEMYSFFDPTGNLDVDKIVTDAKVDDYVGILIPRGAKSPALLSESPAVREFVREANVRNGYCRHMSRDTAAREIGRCAGQTYNRFNLAEQYAELVPQPKAEAAGAIWVNAPVVVEENVNTSPHPDESTAFTRALLLSLDAE
jgi:protease I